MAKIILVFRHAEKPASGDVHLSPQGYARARALVSWIPTTFGTPKFVFAAADTAHSHRPFETVEPLATACTGSTPSTDFVVGDEEGLADRLRSRDYDDALAVVCWHHEKIPKLLHHLKAPPGTYPDPWPDEVFNLIVRLDYPTVTQIIEPF